MSGNPEKAVNAITKPASLTLAQLALFEKIDAPILRADTSCLRDNLIAIWIYKNPTSVVARNFDKREILALEMSEKMTGEEYGSALIEVIEAVTAFYEMMPKKENGEEEEEEEGLKKKTLSDTATGGLPNSQSGFAVSIISRLLMCMMNVLRCVLHFFTGAMRKV